MSHCLKVKERDAKGGKINWEKAESNEYRTSRIKMERKRVWVELLFQDGSQEKKKKHLQGH